MATSIERRRTSDARPPHLIFGPTPGAFGTPDPDGFARSLAYALESATKGRRSLTLVVIEIAARAGGDDEQMVGEVAALVRRTVRDNDGVWRDGPRSLAVLLADCDGPNAEPALARIRLRLRNQVKANVTMGRAAAQGRVDADTLMSLARTDLSSISGR
jgi:GGDEF domain-containing protein